MRKRPFLGLLIAAVAVLALIATGCGSKKSSSGTTSTSSSGGGVTALPASSCQTIYQGSAKPDFIIASDLPLQGSSRTQTIEMTKAIKFVLKQHNFKAGSYNIGSPATLMYMPSAAPPEFLNVSVNELKPSGAMIGKVLPSVPRRSLISLLPFSHSRPPR